MGQKITIRILGRPSPLEAESPEEERSMRDAAEKVDGKYYGYRRKFPEKSSEELLSFVAFNAFLEIDRLEKEIDRMRNEEKDLQASLRSYLDNIGKI